MEARIQDLLSSPLIPALIPPALLFFASCLLFAATVHERRKMQRLLADHNNRLTKFRILRGGRS